MKTIHGRGLGWHRDLPDMRDHTQSTSAVAKVLAKSSALKKAAKTLPASVDLRKYCSPIEDQGQLGSCTAHAGVGMVEYFERRAFGKHVDASRLFLYKVTRQLLGFTGDEMTAHGFRAMASTLLNESGKWNPDAIERALAHGDEDKVRAAYHRGTHWKERVEMAQWWSDYLDQLRKGADVVPFPERKAS